MPSLIDWAKHFSVWKLNERLLSQDWFKACATAANDRNPPILWKNNVLLAQKVAI
jgi:hypothetical protein